MAHTTIPIRFRFLKMPVLWSQGDSPKIGPYLHGIEGGQTTKLTELDGWKWRDEFFRLPENDEALLKFLNNVGEWSPIGEPLNHPLFAHPQEVWRVREELKSALLGQSRKSFLANVTPVLAKPNHRLELFQQHPANNFRLYFEVSDAAAGVVTITNARHMLFATVLADIVSGVRFKVCKRADCAAPFPITSEHARKFCSQYCGHLVSQRKKREEAQKKRREEKRRRTR